MIKTILLIITIGVTSFIYTDIESSNAFFSMVLPFIDFVALVSLALWFVMLFHKKGITQTSGSDGGDSSGIGGFDGGGGDC